MSASLTRIGLISDTHGLLRPDALSFLRGCSRIIHGGDIGGAAILDALARIAPVTAVRGNNDGDPWANALRQIEIVEEQGVRILAIHNLAELDSLPKDVHVVVSGHSHRPSQDERDGVAFINPGSAGPRRFKLPIALGELLIEDGAVRAHIVHL